MDRNLRIQMILEAIDKVTSPLRDIATSSGKAGADLAATRQQLNQLNNAAARVTGFRQLKQDVQTTAAQMRAAENRATELGRQLGQTAAPTKRLQQEFKKAKAEALDLRNRHQQQSSALQEMRGKLDAAGISTRNLAQHERELRNQIGQTNTQLDQQAAKLRSINDRDDRLAAGRASYGRVQGVATGMAVGGATSMATGAAILAPLKGMADEAMAFEDVMADIRKVVDFDTPDQFRQMGDDIMTLSERLPMTAEGIGQIVAAAGQANIPRDELMGFAEDATKMAVAFDTNADEAGNMMAKWRTAFSMGREEVMQLADQVNYLGNTTAAGVKPISDIVTRIGPLGEIGGLASSAIGALGATIASMGTAPEIAATGIKNLTLAMTRGEKATKAQHSAWAALGLNAKAVAEGMQQDANATILNVLERFQAIPKDAQAGLLTQLFGSESVAAIAPLLTQLDTLKENFDKVGDASRYAGSMEAEYAARAETTSNAVQLSENAVKNMKTTLGDALSPTVRAVAARIGALALGLRNWAAENPRLARVILLVVAGLGALLAIFGGLAIAVAGLLAPFAALSFAAGALNIALLPVIGIAAGIIAAMAALAGIVYLVYRNWEAIKGFFATVWAEIKTAFDGGIWGVIALLWKLGGMAMVAIVNGITAAANWLGTNGPGLLLGAWNIVKNVLWNGVMLLPRLFFQFGVNTITGLVRGILSVVPTVLKAIGSVGSTVITAFKEKLGIHSPSRVFAALGGHITDGLSVGLVDGQDRPIARAGALAASLAGAFAAGSGGAMAAPIGVDMAPVTAPGAARAAAAGPASAGGASVVNHYSITIHVQGGANGPDMNDFERKMRAMFEDLRREEAARTFRDN